jgi:hypothetical protein
VQQRTLGEWWLTQQVARLCVLRLSPGAASPAIQTQLAQRTCSLSVCWSTYLLRSPSTTQVLMPHC